MNYSSPENWFLPQLLKLLNGTEFQQNLKGLNNVCKGLGTRKTIDSFLPASSSLCSRIGNQLPWPRPVVGSDLLNSMEQLLENSPDDNALDSESIAIQITKSLTKISAPIELCEIGMEDQPLPAIQSEIPVFRGKFWTLFVQPRTESYRQYEEAKYRHTLGLYLEGYFTQNAVNSLLTELGLVGRSLAQSCRLVGYTYLDGINSDELVDICSDLHDPVDTTGLDLSGEEYPRFAISNLISLINTVLRIYIENRGGMDMPANPVERRMLNAIVFLRDADVGASPVSKIASSFSSIDALLGENVKNLRERLLNRIISLLNPPNGVRSKVDRWLNDLWDIRNNVIHGDDPLVASRKIAAQFRLLASCVLIAVFNRTNKGQSGIDILFKELDNSNQSTAELFKLQNSFWQLVQDQFC